MKLLKQSSTAQPLMFLLIDSSDHITGKTGLSPTVTLSKNGGSFASPAGAVTEIANGWYKVAGNTTDTATLGPLILHATGTGADPTDEQFEIVAFDPQLNFSGTAAAGASGGLLISGSNAGTTTFGALTVTGASTFTGDVSFGSTFGITGNTTFSGSLQLMNGVQISCSTSNQTAVQIWGNGQGDGVRILSGNNSGACGLYINAISATGSALVLASTNADGLLTSTLHVTGAVTGLSTLTQTQVNGGAFASPLVVQAGTAQAGAATTITLSSGASAVNDFYKRKGIVIISGTGAGQTNVITGYVGSTKVATVSAWGTNPDNTSVYAVMSITGLTTAIEKTYLAGTP